jgi:hypothetical protein
MIVRRPLDPAKFNGIAAIEWHNVTAGQDIERRLSRRSVAFGMSN